MVIYALQNYMLEKIVKRERAGKYIYDILYIPAKGVFILADDMEFMMIGYIENYGTYMDNRNWKKILTCTNRDTGQV